MKLRLKEEPREWQKFTGVMAALSCGIAWVISRKALNSPALFWLIAGIGLLAVLLSLVAPRRFRGFYRTGMTVSWHVGQAIGRVMLTVFFLLLVTPMGLLLRLAGKDLLDLKRKSAETFWKPASRPGPFDRQF